VGGPLGAELAAREVGNTRRVGQGGERGAVEQVRPDELDTRRRQPFDVVGLRVTGDSDDPGGAPGGVEGAPGHHRQIGADLAADPEEHDVTVGAGQRVDDRRGRRGQRLPQAVHRPQVTHAALRARSEGTVTDRPVSADSYTARTAATTERP
jgi:hypothetical protein